MSGEGSVDAVTTNRAAERVAFEAIHLRRDIAALKALDRVGDGVDCAFMRVASSGIHADVLIRLMRVLERDGRVRGFWFLHRSGAIQADRATVNFLSGIADRLEPIRNTVFAHIDKVAVHDPQQPYRGANLRWLSDIERAISSISELINTAIASRAGEPFAEADISIADYEGMFVGELERFRESDFDI